MLVLDRLAAVDRLRVAGGGRLEAVIVAAVEAAEDRIFAVKVWNAGTPALRGRLAGALFGRLGFDHRALRVGVEVIGRNANFTFDRFADSFVGNVADGVHHLRGDFLFHRLRDVIADFRRHRDAHRRLRDGLAFLFGRDLGFRLEHGLANLRRPALVDAAVVAAQLGAVGAVKVEGARSPAFRNEPDAFLFRPPVDYRTCLGFSLYDRGCVTKSDEEEQENPLRNLFNK